MLVRVIKKYSTGKITLASFFISMSIYLLMVFYSIPLVSSYATGMLLFDVSPAGYTYEYAMSLLSNLGEPGRYKYLTLQLPLDFIYPLTFGLSHALIVFWVLNKINIVSPTAQYASALPIIGSLFDYSENILISGMLNNYPSITEGYVQLASGFTVAKSVFVTITYLVICGLLIKLTITAFKSKKAKTLA